MSEGAMGLKLKFAIAVVAAASMLSGCVTTVEGYRQHMDLLTNQSTDQLLIEMGLPNSVKSLPDGKEEWRYYERVEYYGSGGTTTNTNTSSYTYKDKNGVKQTREETSETLSYTPPSVSSDYCSTVVIVDHGKVVSYSFEGRYCAAREIKKNKNSE